MPPSDGPFPVAFTGAVTYALNGNLHPKIKTGLARLLSKSGLLALLERYRSGPVVFALHRVLPEAEMGECYNPHLAISPASLEGFLQYLKVYYEATDLGHLLQKAPSRNGKPACAITFDDGWEDNYRHAFPLLQAYGVPATVFLCTGLVGSESMLPEERWWRVWKSARAGGAEAALLAEAQRRLPAAGSLAEVGGGLKKVPIEAKLQLLSELEARFGTSRPPRRSFMDWEQVREMAEAGVTFGSHTVRHAVLPAEGDASLQRELEESRQALLARGLAGAELIAYPNGGFDARVVEAAKKCGYRAGCTTRTGMVTNATPPYEIPRHPVDNLVMNDAGGRFCASRARLHIWRGNAAPASAAYG